MQEEYDAQIKKGTWSLVPRQNNVHVMRSMWIHRYKYDSEGNLVRHKSRLISNGRSQQPDIDCDETFSHVVKPETIRLVLDIALSKNWPLHQLDVPNAFLNGDLQETVYMHQPSGFKDLLHKVLYGLKQTRAGYQRFATFTIRVGFKQSNCDSALFIHHSRSGIRYLRIYVDDILLTASSTALRYPLLHLSM